MADKDGVLRILPCEPKDYNTGRCRLDIATMESLGLIVGSPVKIKTTNIYIYCNVWPRETVSSFERFIQFDELVTCPGTSSNMNSGLLTQNISIPKGITKLEPQESTNISVAIFVKDMDGRGKASSSRSLFEKQLTRALTVFLKGLTITKECIVKPRTCKTQSNLLKTVSSIVIEDIQPHGDIANYIFTENTKIKFNSIKMDHVTRENTKFTMAGLDKASQLLKELLIYPFEFPESFAHIGLECPKGILLQGAPGVGKTLLVRTVTAMCNAQLITLNGTDVFGPHFGESEEYLRKTFEKARLASKSGPCVLFIDEIDALCPKRGTSSNEEENRIVAQLLTLMDGMEMRGKVIVIGATNRPNAIDSALRRPGRFDREVVIGVPGAAKRLAILKAHTANIMLDNDVDLSYLAETTIGYVGADLESLCKEASFVAMKRTLHSHCTANEQLNSNDRTVKMSDFQLAMCHITPSTHRGMEGLVDARPISWSDIGGLNEVKQALKQAIEWPLKYPESYSRLGLQRPHAVLLYGPPGCCKTTLVHALASSCHCTFLSLSCATLFSPYVGDAEKTIREVFMKARGTTPSILFLDELDSIAGKRSNSSGNDVSSRLLASLLNEIDGVGVSANIYSSDIEKNTGCPLEATKSREIYLDSKSITCSHDGSETNEERLLKLQSVKDLILVAATNRPNSIDEALLRPGRIDRIVYVPPPDRDARMEILKVHTRSCPISRDVSLDVIANQTEMFSGADLENLCREAAIFALEEDLTTTTINKHHFEKALLTVKPSLTVEQLNQYIKWK